KEFIPEGPEDEFVVELIFPKGTSLEGNAVVTEKIENAVLSIDGVTGVVSNIGRVNEFDFLNRDQISVDKSNIIVKIRADENYKEVKEKNRIVNEKIICINYMIRHNETAFKQIINPYKNDIVINIKYKYIESANV